MTRKPVILYSSTGHQLVATHPLGFVWSLPQTPRKSETPPSDAGCASAVGFEVQGMFYESGYQGRSSFLR